MRLAAAFVLTACIASAQNPFRELFWPEITKYLSLTDDQLQKVRHEAVDYAQWVTRKQVRLSTVQGEITEETAKNPLDPTALGIRYAELEVIRREIADRGQQTITANTSLLTDPQKLKLKELEEALKLSPISEDARTLYLLPPSEPVCYEFAAFLLGLPVTSFPPCGTQIIRLPFPGGVQIRAYLSLTDDQLQKLTNQIADHSRWVQAKQERMFLVQAEIAAETAKSPLDPAALGIRHVELEVIRREIAGREKQLAIENIAILTDPQKATLKTLEDALKLEQTGAEARSLGFLPQVCTGAVFSRNIIPASRVIGTPSTACGAGTLVFGFNQIP